MGHVETWRTLVHEGGHYGGNPNERTAEAGALNGCVSRNLQEEKKYPKNPPPDPNICEDPLADCGEPGDDDPGDGLIHGYCEYEGRVSCWTDDDGIDWCYEYWIRLYCVVF